MSAPTPRRLHDQLAGRVKGEHGELPSGEHLHRSQTDEAGHVERLVRHIGREEPQRARLHAPRHGRGLRGAAQATDEQVRRGGGARGSLPDAPVIDAARE